jgi:hypothetical protein
MIYPSLVGTIVALVVDGAEVTGPETDVGGATGCIGALEAGGVVAGGVCC